MSSPLEYQIKLMEEHKAANEEAQIVVDEAFKMGHTVMSTGVVNGPYVIYTTYFLSNRASVTIKSAASLHWVGFELVGGW